MMVKYVFECFKCGEQANPDNILDREHVWIAYEYNNKKWYKENGDILQEYYFEIKVNK